MLGTALEYYDITLYAFLAPILAPIFLPELDSKTSLLIFFLTYGVSISAKPLGSYIFGKIGDKDGRCIPLSITMFGMATCSILIAIMPTYQYIGYAAIVIFGVLRALQNFFISGEYHGGAIYCLEHTRGVFRPGTVSGYYCAATVGGILGAAMVSSLVVYAGYQYWRFAYVIGAFGCIGAILIRKKLTESPEFIMNKKQANNSPSLVTPVPLLACLLLATCSLFFSMLYGLSAKVLNAIIPQVSIYSIDIVIHINTIVIVLYGALLIAGGYLSNYLGAFRQMQIFALLTLAFIIPILKLPFDNLTNIFMVKFIIIFLVAGFIAPIHVVAISLVPVLKRYKIISLYSSFGKLLAGFTPALYIYIWSVSNSLFYIGVLIAFVATIALYLLFHNSAYLNKD